MGQKGEAWGLCVSCPSFLCLPKGCLFLGRDHRVGSAEKGRIYGIPTLLNLRSFPRTTVLQQQILKVFQSDSGQT